MADNVCSLSLYGCTLIGKIDANQVRLRMYRRRRPLERQTFAGITYFHGEEDVFRKGFIEKLARQDNDVLVQCGPYSCSSGLHKKYYGALHQVFHDANSHLHLNMAFWG